MQLTRTLRGLLCYRRRQMVYSGVTAVLLVLTSIVASCTKTSRESFDNPEVRRDATFLRHIRAVPANLLRVNDRRGSYAGVALGQRAEAVQRVFGVPPPWKDYYRDEPLDASPTLSGGGFHCPISNNPDAYTFMRYRGVSFEIVNKTVCGIMVTDKRAVTERGVRVGDHLASAQSKYPTLTCGHITGSEGSEQSYCTGALSPGRYVVFSAWKDEPIDVIGLGLAPYVRRGQSQ